MPNTLPKKHLLTRTALLGAAAGIGYSALFVSHREPLPHAVSGERHEITGAAGPLSYYVAGTGAPLLLIHSINAAGSAYEIKPLFEALKSERRVYALDLPGFGFSDRSAREYTVRLYVDAIHDLLGLISDENPDAPIDAVALSLSSEFLVRAVLERPGRVRSLALVNPTGFSRGSEALRGQPGATREVPGLYGFFTFPVWSRAFYDLLVSRASIRYFLQRTYGSKQVDEDLVKYDYLTAHQPGARHAPYAFVSGRLFSRDVRSLYERLTLPVWMPHGTRGDFRDFSQAQWTQGRANWTVQAFPTGALPHFEQPDAFMASYRRFLASMETSEVSAALR